MALLSGDGRASWDGWYVFPARYKDISPTAAVAITVFDGEGALLGGCTLPLFHRSLLLREGLQRARLWIGRAACLHVVSTTPALADEEDERDDEPLRLRKLLEARRRGHMPACGWLDRLSLPRVAAALAEDTTPTTPEAKAAALVARSSAVAAEASLLLDLPSFTYPILFDEEPYAPPTARTLDADWQQTIDRWTGRVCYVNTTRGELSWRFPAQLRPAAETDTQHRWAQRLAVVWDPDIGADNLSDVKFFKVETPHPPTPLLLPPPPIAPPNLPTRARGSSPAVS